MLTRHQINLSQVRQWLNMCEPQPEDRCGPSTNQNIPNFKVVDVQTNRVVSAPEKCTYIALSYIWGSTQPFRIKRDDFHSLQYSAGSSIVSYAQLARQKLPRTIRDAMFVVEAVGERYLWVDSLCILDDDEVEFKEMIHKMDTIYKSASFTIIAAGGEDADFGLPGLYPGSRSIQYSTGSIDGVGLLSTEKNMRLDLSPWAKRGWTYQEYQFSTKALVFVDDRVFLE
ncbi:HET-domain-containing protein, partial [Amniculicola lignicola CBS 123094]